MIKKVLILFLVLSMAVIPCLTGCRYFMPDDGNDNSDGQGENNKPENPDDQGGNKPPDTSDDIQYEYSLSFSKKEFKKGESAKIEVLVSPEKEFTVEFSTNAPNVADVDKDGNIRAIGAGNAIITASVDNQKLTCDIVVYEYTLNYERMYLKVGDTKSLVVSSNPTKDITVEYKSSNTDILEVNENGSVNAKSAGIATVTASVDGVDLLCEVIVSDYALSTTKEELKIGDEFKLLVAANPDVEFEVEYKTDNSDVVTVDAEGNVTAVGVGTTKITATVDGLVMVCTVSVHKYELSQTVINGYPGYTSNLSVIVTPVKNYTATYESDNEDVAVVNEQGEITCIAVGNAKITASVDGVEFECIVNVNNYAISVTKDVLKLGESSIASIVSNLDAVENIVYSTSDSSVITVDSAGVITGCGCGTANVVAVINGVIRLEQPILVYSDAYYATQVNIKSGEKFSYSLSFYEESYSPKTVEYTSSDSSVVTVDSNGVISAVSAGNAVIFIKVDGKTWTSSVNVSQGYSYSLSADTIRVKLGERALLEVIVTPGKDIENGNLVFTSANSEIASIGAGTGVIYGNNVGVTTITVLVDGVYLSCNVEVYQ